MLSFTEGPYYEWFTAHFRDRKWRRLWFSGAFDPVTVIKEAMKARFQHTDVYHGYLYQDDIQLLNNASTLEAPWEDEKPSTVTIDAIFAVMSDLRVPRSWFPRIFLGLGIADDPRIREKWASEIDEYLQDD